MTNSQTEPAAKTTDLHLALMGGLARRGQWRTHRRTIAISPVGGADLDLSEATLPDDEATVIKVSLVGGVHLTVPAAPPRRDRSCLAPLPSGSSPTESSAAYASSGFETPAGLHRPPSNPEAAGLGSHFQ
jgi:hypothetical protein